VAAIVLDESLKDYIVRLVHATREHPDVSLGASPRGSLGLLKGAKAMAGLQGRNYVLPDDIKRLAEPTLAHRLILKAESFLKGKTAENVIQEVVNQTPLTL
jgi:MoxR-like ATPase